MFVWCESFHGLGGDITDDLKSIYGDASVKNNNLLYGVVSNFDGGQPGLSLAIAGTDGGTLRMGPGITGNHNFSSRSQWYLHFAYKLDNLSAGDATIVALEDTTVYPSNMTQCVLMAKNYGPSGNKFALFDSVGGTSLVESSSYYNQSGVYYLQLYIQIGASAASKLIVSGVTQWDTTGLDTQATANATANAVSFWATFPRITQVGNIVIADNQADGLTPSFNTLLGDFIVVKIQPNAVGDIDDFTPVGASTNWEAVDDSVPDDDTTYNETNAASAKDVMNYENLPAIIDTTIYGVNLRTRHRKTEAGSRKLTHIVKPTTVEYLKYVHTTLDTWQWFSDSYDINPDTSARYSKSEIDAHQFGYKGETV